MIKIQKWHRGIKRTFFS